MRHVAPWCRAPGGQHLDAGRPDHRDPWHPGRLAHRLQHWIPSIQAVVGNIGVFGGHVWTADTQTAAERAAWVAQLDEMAALKPPWWCPAT